MNNPTTRMAEQSRVCFSEEDVLVFLDEDDLDGEEDGDMNDVFFPGSDEELGCELDTGENKEM